MRVLTGDMASLPNETFDILTNTYTSFGYLDSEQQDMALLRHWYTRLRPGGVLIMELADLERAHNRLCADGTLHRRTGSVDEFLSFDWETSLLRVEYVADTDERWTCYTRLYSVETLERELRDTGFSSIRVYGDFDGKAKEPDDNLVLMATR